MPVTDQTKHQMSVPSPVASLQLPVVVAVQQAAADETPIVAEVTPIVAQPLPVAEVAPIVAIATVVSARGVTRI
jgi:hypothetical protein